MVLCISAFYTINDSRIFVEYVFGQPGSKWSESGLTLTLLKGSSSL